MTDIENRVLNLEKLIKKFLDLLPTWWEFDDEGEELRGLGEMIKIPVDPCNPCTQPDGMDCLNCAHYKHEGITIPRERLQKFFDLADTYFCSYGGMNAEEYEFIENFIDDYNLENEKVDGFHYAHESLLQQCSEKGCKRLSTIKVGHHPYCFEHMMEFWFKEKVVLDREIFRKFMNLALLGALEKENKKFLKDLREKMDKSHQI